MKNTINVLFLLLTPIATTRPMQQLRTLARQASATVPRVAARLTTRASNVVMQPVTSRTLTTFTAMARTNNTFNTIRTFKPAAKHVADLVPTTVNNFTHQRYTSYNRNQRPRYVHNSVGLALLGGSAIVGTITLLNSLINDPLFEACKEGDLEKIQKYLDEHPQDIEKKCNYWSSTCNGLTPLGVALQFQQTEAAMFLICKGANIEYILTQIKELPTKIPHITTQLQNESNWLAKLFSALSDYAHENKTLKITITPNTWIADERLAKAIESVDDPSVTTDISKDARVYDLIRFEHSKYIQPGLLHVIYQLTLDQRKALNTYHAACMNNATQETRAELKWKLDRIMINKENERDEILARLLWLQRDKTLKPCFDPRTTWIILAFTPLCPVTIALLPLAMHFDYNVAYTLNSFEKIEKVYKTSKRRAKSTQRNFSS